MPLTKTWNLIWVSLPILLTAISSFGGPLFVLITLPRDFHVSFLTLVTFLVCSYCIGRYIATDLPAAKEAIHKVLE